MMRHTVPRSYAGSADRKDEFAPVRPPVAARPVQAQLPHHFEDVALLRPDIAERDAPWDPSAPIQMLRTQSSLSWGAWYAGVEDDQHLKAVHAALGDYHRERSEFATDQAFSDHRAQALDRAEHATYQHLGAMGDLQQGGSKRNYMLDLMDEIQSAHRDHVDYVHQNNLELYSHDALSGQQRQDLNASWNAVRNSQGAVRLSPDEADNREHRANFARLMSRRHGRELVAALQQGNNDLPLQIAMRTTNRPPAGEAARRKENLRAQQATDAAILHAQAQPASPAQQAEVARLLEVRMSFLDATAPGYRNPNPLEPAAASPPQQNVSYLRVLRGLRDSENLSHSGVHTGLIASPAHIILGHELIHALHYKRNQHNPDAYAANGPLSHWGNLEEHTTIATGAGPTENLLRAEHNLAAREGHTSKTREEVDAEERAQRLKTAAKWGVGALALAGAAYGAYRYLRR